jgi:hypothetical protein
VSVRYNRVLMYMSQAIAEISHFRICLEFPQLPMHFQKMYLKFTIFKFWETAHQQEKTELTYLG